MARPLLLYRPYNIPKTHCNRSNRAICCPSSRFPCLFSHSQYESCPMRLSSNHGNLWEVAVGPTSQRKPAPIRLLKVGLDGQRDFCGKPKGILAVSWKWGAKRWDLSCSRRGGCWQGPVWQSDIADQLSVIGVERATHSPILAANIMAPPLKHLAVSLTDVPRLKMKRIETKSNRKSEQCGSV